MEGSLAVTPDKLDKMRKRIREIDRKILELTAERMGICRDVGEYKKKQKLPIKDYKVEKFILERARKQALDLNIIPELAESLIQQLIKYSVLEQDEIKANQLHGSSNSDKNVLIIGGAGNIGGWMSQFFASMGYSVRIHDKNPPEESIYDLEHDIDEGLAWAGITILALPMLVTNQMLLDISKKGYQGVVLEVSSLKAPLLTGLKACWQAGIQAVSIHPMFSSDVRTLVGHNIILCSHPLCSQEAFALVENIFKLTSANVVSLPLEEHDRFMSYVLGSSHFINLLYAKIIEESQLSQEKLEALSGTTFMKQMAVTKDVINENLDMYFDIQNLNLKTKDLLEGIERILATIKNQVLNGKREEFIESMEKAKQHIFESKD